MAAISDGLVVAALIGYLAAMVGHAVELAAALRSARPVPAAAPARLGSTVATAEAATPARAAAPLWWLRRAVVVLTVGATVAHAGAVVARGWAAGRVPLGNLYEFILAVTLAGAVAWLVAQARRPVREAGLFVTLALALLLGGAARVYTRVEPLVPALESPWLRVHVSAAATATGLLLVGFVAAALYLLRLRHDALVSEGRHPSPVIGRLPAPAALDRLAMRLHQVAFPIWTFAIVAGAIWAEAAWGRYWGWDPKETWAFVSWVLYACYLHARSTAGWRGRRAALVAMVAWATMLVNLFVVNLLFTGLHSYAGL
ncbi:MAG TPA: c-type cytochrome biogenesis protein CcsB [Natronosporangium sp.]